MMSIVTQILFWLVVWLLVSIPLAIVIGKQLRSVRKMQTRPVDEVGPNHQTQRKHFNAAAERRSALRSASKHRVVGAR